MGHSVRRKKGKTTERWRRKVTGLRGHQPYGSGTAHTEWISGTGRLYEWKTYIRIVYCRMAGANKIKVFSGRRFAAAMFVLAACLGVDGKAAQAQATNCSDFPNSTLDGFVTPNPPSNINIDSNCTVRNFPADNPLPTNFSFFTQPGQTNERWLIVFDNVVHTGNMSCNSVLEHKIWFTNGSSSKIRDNCQNLLIPVEKIDKQNPPGTTTAAIGVPFTYRLVSPVLFDPATTTVINTQGSVNDLHSITMSDDPVSYTHLTLPTTSALCRSRWSPYH